MSQPLITSETRLDGVADKAQTFKVSFINVILLLAGSSLHIISEMSLLPIVAALVYYLAGWTTLLLPRLGRVWERRMYNRLFAVGFLVAGVSAFYRVFAGDLQNDAEKFFERSANLVDGWSLLEISSITEGAVAVIMWREMFDFMSSIGFPREQYIGIFVNVTVMSLTGVVAIKMARLVYGEDIYRFKRLILLFSTCGLMWIFSGIMIRDSTIIMGVSLLAYVWLYFLSKPSLGFRFFMIVAASLLAGPYLGFMRAEFAFVPIAMAIAAVTALLLGRNVRRGKIVARLLILIGLMVSGWLIANYGEALQLILLRGKEGYSEAASSTSSSGSMGMSLIINQPMLIRLTLGAIYLFVFPIPFWVGFQFESSYHLFKSFNVIYLYFVIPLLTLTVRQLWKDKFVRSPSMLFLLFLVFGFTLVIAATSLETRHLGAFFVPVFLLALLPDLRLKIVRHNYRQFLIAFLGTVFVVHYMWIIIRFGFFIVPITIIFVLLFFLRDRIILVKRYFSRSNF